MPLETPHSTAKTSMVGTPLSVKATSTIQPTMPSAAPITYSSRCDIRSAKRMKPK